MEEKDLVTLITEWYHKRSASTPKDEKAYLGKPQVEEKPETFPEAKPGPTPEVKPSTTRPNMPKRTRGEKK